jgi:beta-glucanase (GH16 family)
LLILAEITTGTLLACNHYVWYGKISVTMKTSRGAGVVTAFVMMSDIKDEIDVEFIGVDLRTTQTSYFFQGIETGKSRLLNYSTLMDLCSISNACSIL